MSYKFFPRNTGKIEIERERETVPAWLAGSQVSIVKHTTGRQPPNEDGSAPRLKSSG